MIIRIIQCSNLRYRCLILPSRIVIKEMENEAEESLLVTTPNKHYAGPHFEWRMLTVLYTSVNPVVSSMLVIQMLCHLPLVSVSFIPTF